MQSTLKMIFHLCQKIQDTITRNIEFISEEIIPIKLWLKSQSLCKNVDEKDIPYIAFCLFFKCKLWTGDKKLISGLNLKGFYEFNDTNELFEIIKL